jgi:putative membrane protein
VSEVAAARWHRLHPLSPLVRAGRAAIALAVIVLPSLSGAGSGPWDSLGHAAVVGVLAVLGFVSWLVTRWRIEGDTLRIETGLLRRSSLRYPLAQIQAIDTVRPGLARLFGLSELRLRMAGTGGAAKLAYLPSSRAEELRGQLLALAAGAHPDTPEARDAEILVAAPTGRIVASLALSAPVIWLATVFVTVGVVSVAAPSAGRAVVGSSSVFLISSVVALWRQFNGSYRLTVTDAPEGLRVRAGLVETVAETIPRGRVQAVRLVEPLLWQPFGWCKLYVDVAGRARDHNERRRNGRELRILLPVGTKADAARLLERIVPGAPEPRSRPPRRARWRSPLRYRRLAYGFDGVYAVAVTGRLARACSWVPLAKIQSLRRIQDPAQRRLGLATVYLDTAGKSVGAALRDVDAAQSLRQLDRLTDLARAARRA